MIVSQDGSGDLDLAELNAVLASISGGAMSAGGGSDGNDSDKVRTMIVKKQYNSSTWSNNRFKRQDAGGQCRV